MRGVKRCGSCQFKDDEQCKRFPPVHNKDKMGEWPHVDDDDWCGEYIAVDRVTLFKNMQLGANAE